MNKKLKCYLIMLILVFAAIGLSKTAYAEVFQTWPAKSDVIHEKIWTIKFNKPIKDILQVKNKTSVVDSKGNIISIDVAYGNDKNEIKILPPAEGYFPGETYTLTIGPGLLPKPAKMSFTIELPLNEELKPIENRKLFDDTYLTTNYNLDLLFISGAVGSGFKLTHYLPNSDIGDYNLNSIIMNAKSYFEKYTDNAAAKQINGLCSSFSYGDIQSTTFNNAVASGVISYEQFLKDSMVYKLSDENKQVTGDKSVKEIKNLLNRFSNDSKAEDFFKKNRELYHQMLDSYAIRVNFDYVKRLKEFYGNQMTGSKFQIILSPAIAGGQAFELQDNSGTLTYINITNPIESSFERMINVLYHETSHNFYSGIEQNNKELINGYSKYSDALGKGASFERQLNETLARAVTAVMLDKYHGNIVAQKNITKELSSGWKNLDNIYFLIKNKYLSDRYKYPTFEKFLPIILEYIKSASLNQSFDVGPKENMVKAALVLGGKEDCEKFYKKFSTEGKLTNASLASQSDINNSGIIALFDYPGQLSLPERIVELFKDMTGTDKNYINIKNVDGKLLIYIKAESQQKILEIIDDTDDVYTEKYQAF